jgi:outer membrane lipoprotein-sorting protein
MMKAALAICMLYAVAQGSAFAACSAEDAMNKGSEVSDVLSTKLQTKPDESSKMMTEMGDIMGTGTVNEQTCVKLDSLMVRAKKL